MEIFKHTTKRKTAFAEFITSAPSREKKRVYRVVLEKAAESQDRVIKAAKTAHPA